jgi:hypothetical protein
MQWKDPKLKVRPRTDEVYAEIRKEFGEEELVNLSLTIITIDGWNGFATGSQNPR